MIQTMPLAYYECMKEMALSIPKMVPLTMMCCRAVCLKIFNVTTPWNTPPCMTLQWSSVNSISMTAITSWRQRNMRNALAGSSITTWPWTKLRKNTYKVKRGSASVSRPGQLRNYLWNVQRLVSDRTWLQRLGEECCTLVKSLSQILECRDNSEVRLNIVQWRSQVAFRGESETLAEDQRGVES